ncbi:hypothetical protein Patl1_36804 [Pistacia atlantica]|nr:hypothetical protein Patl1_36804 [Pistacia atlantica]
MNLILSIGTVWRVFLARGVRPELDQCTYIMCQKVIELLQSCCEKCNYDSTHCASVSGLLKQIGKR